MRIITAIGNTILNEKLKKNTDIKVIGKDIQYQEGILEVLEENKDIDLLVLSNILPGEWDFYKLINEIKKANVKLEIVVFLSEKDENIENFLSSKNIYKIYYLNDYDFDKFLESFLVKKHDFISRNY
ncbi:MAG: hypothetical protein IJW20_01895 [Clostridia bacterium]|nr:hypothetical protein [Clostridia bacterium]